MGKPPEPKAVNQEQLEIKPAEKLQDEIERQIGPLLPQQQRGQIVQRLVAIMMSEKFSGPIAHPKHLREYEDILPGSAERIVSMAEREQAHNMEMESRIISGQISDQKLGMWFGLAALLVVVVLAFIAGMMGNNILAGFLLGAGVLGIVGSFIKGRFSQ